MKNIKKRFYALRDVSVFIITKFISSPFLSRRYKTQRKTIEDGLPSDSVSDPLAPSGYNINLAGAHARLETYDEYLTSYALRGFKKNILQRKKPRHVKLSYRPKPHIPTFEQRPIAWSNAYRSADNFEDDMHPGEIAELDELTAAAQGNKK